MAEKHDQWMANGVHEYANSGNMKPSSRKMIVQWILDSYKEVHEKIIVKSFKVCVLNLNVDGSENGNIHSLKKDQPCQEGYNQLQTHLSILDDENYVNPFSTDSDTEEAAELFHLLHKDEGEDGI